MLAMAYSENQYVMPHNAVFHPILQCLLRKNNSSEKEIKFYLEVITC